MIPDMCLIRMDKAPLRGLGEVGGVQSPGWRPGLRKAPLRGLGEVGGVQSPGWRPGLKKAPLRGWRRVCKEGAAPRLAAGV